jgi:hypothetical protein
MTVRVYLEDRLLLLCTVPTLREGHIVQILDILKEDIDWSYFLKKASENGIFLHAYENLTLALSKLSKQTKHESSLKNMKKAYHEHLIANLIIQHEAKKAVTALSRHKIVYTPIKGFLLATTTYPNGVSRDFRDVDLLFPNGKERAKAEKVLGSMDFRRVPNAHPVYHTIMRKRSFKVDVNIELHVSLPGIGYFYQYPTISGFWETLTAKVIGGTRLLVMSPEDMVLTLALHAFREGYIQLKDVSDLTAIIESTPEFNWRKIKEYQKRPVWRYLLAAPLFAYFNTRQILDGECKEELDELSKQFLHYPLDQSYPIFYSSLCESFACDKKCKNCIWIVQKRIPPKTDDSPMSLLIRNFPTRLKLSSYFLVVYVRRDCGMKYTLTCCMSVIQALIQTSYYVARLWLTNRKDE